MFVLFLLFILFEIGSPWPDLNSEMQSVIKLRPIDYADFPLMTSRLPRTNKTASRTYFQLNDFDIETEKIKERFPAKIDMGQGKANYLPAQSVLNALVEVSKNQSDPDSYENHQYSRITGHQRLVEAVSIFYSFLMRRKLDPINEILITTGTITSLDLVARSFINPGDEVIVFEPFYNEFRGIISLSGGKMVTVPLRIKEGKTGHSSSDWSFDERELESKINRNTKLILLNNPNNPLGKVYSKNELTFIGYLAIKYDLIIISDEAAQWYITTNEPDHIFISSLPGLFERTITLISGGKLFTNSGWRIGWVIGPDSLLWPMNMVYNYAVHSGPTPLQVAYAIGLETELQRWGTPESYFYHLKGNVTKARNRLVSILRSVGAEVVSPSAAYVLVANFTRLSNQIDLSNQTDMRPGLRFWKYMLIEKGIVTSPMSIYYSEKNMWKTEYCLRFCILKTSETLDQFERLLFTIFTKTIHIETNNIETINIDTINTKTNNPSLNYVNSSEIGLNENLQV